MSMTNVEVRNERVTRAMVTVPQRNQVASENFLLIVPPRVTVGNFVNAALQQKAALEAAVRLWENSFGGRDPALPRAFNPMVIQGKFGCWKILLQEDEANEHNYVMEMTSRKVFLEMDMAYPADALRQSAQKYDSDHHPKEFGAVVGGNTLITAEEMKVGLGPFAEDPMMHTQDFKVEGLMIFASKEPEAAKCVTVLTALNSIFKKEADRLQGVFVLRQRKDGIALKLYGDISIQVRLQDRFMHYGICP